MDPGIGDLRGDVLIDSGRIVKVAEHVSDDSATIVELDGAVVIPGLIDTHVHLWQEPLGGLASSCWGREYFGVVHPLSGRYRPSDMYTATYGGALQMLTKGVTTVFDFCHATNSPEHAAASLRGLDDAGIRAVFGFCFRHRPEAQIAGFETLEDRRVVLEALHATWKTHDRVRIGVALNNIDHVSPEIHQQELLTARDLGMVASIHSNLAGQVSVTDDLGLLGSDLLWVHAGEITDEELSLLGRYGGAVVCTPEIEVAQMAVTPVANRAVRHGVPVGFGTDVPAAFNGDMITQLRIANVLMRADDGRRQRASGRPGVREADNPLAGSADLLKMATAGSAEILGLADEIGSITPGKKADLVVIGTQPWGLAAATPTDYVLFRATSRNIERVYVGGRLVVSDGVPVDADLAALRADLDETREWVLGIHAASPWEPIDAAAQARYERGQGKA